MAISSVPVTEANIATFRRAIEEGWNKGNLAAIDGALAPDSWSTSGGSRPDATASRAPSRPFALRSGPPPRGRRCHRRRRPCLAAAPCNRYTTQGTFMGVPGTGRAFDITVIDIARVADGRLVEHWGVADRLSLAQQIGAAPGGPR